MPEGDDAVPPVADDPAAAAADSAGSGAQGENLLSFRKHVQGDIFKT